MPPIALSQLSPTSLLGKVPRRGDFVHHNPTAASKELDLWIQAAVGEMHRLQQVFPPRIARLAMALPHSGHLALGVIAPSQDQVGRRYPVTLVNTAPLPPAGVLLDLPTLEAFYAQREALIRELPALPYEELLDRLSTMPPPTTAQDTWDEPMSADAFLQATLGTQDKAEQSYALSTFCAAATAHRHTPAAAGVAVPVTANTAAESWAWLNLAQRFAHVGRGLSAVLWDSPGPGTMLLCWGPPPVLALCFWATGGPDTNQLWPLTTQVPEARADASAALGRLLVAHEQQPLAELWRGLEEHFR